MSNALIELQQLAARRPLPMASAADVAAWYRGKGDLLERLAPQAGDPAAVAVTLDLASRARAHAAALLRSA